MKKFEKVLDKRNKDLYNIRTGSKGSNGVVINTSPVTDLQSAIDKYSVDKTKSNDYLVALQKVARKLFEACKEKNIPIPIISGGVIRDIIFGMSPNDVDIFFDLQNLDLREEDELLLACHSIKEGLLKGPTHQKGEVYDDTPFIVYCSYLSHDFDKFKFVMADMICHKGKTLLETVDTFHYSLAKGYMNCETGEVTLSEDLKRDLSRGFIEIEDEKGINKISAFYSNYHWHLTSTLSKANPPSIMCIKIDPKLGKDFEKHHFPFAMPKVFIK